MEMKFLDGETNKAKDEMNKLLYKKEIFKILKNELNIEANLQDIIILGTHYHKHNYNFVYNGSKYLIKDRMFDNILNDSEYYIIQSGQIKDMEKFKEYNNQCIIELKTLLDDTQSFNKTYQHFPKILNSTENLYEVEYFENLEFFSEQEFFKQYNELIKMYNYKIHPMSISKINCGLVNNEIKFFDFDAINCMHEFTRKYIHYRKNDIIYFKGDKQDVELFHFDMKDNIKEYKE